MRISVLTALLLFASCCSANGWFGPFRRQIYQRLPSYSRHVFSSPSGRTTFDIGNEDSDDYFRTWAGLHHAGDNWNSSIRGTIDSDGNYGFDAGLSFEFRKRSVDSGRTHYKITLFVDPCNFNTYDLNRDDTITKNELYAIFGNNKEADALFAVLDKPTGDEVIDPDEFDLVAPTVITECLADDVE